MKGGLGDWKAAELAAYENGWPRLNGAKDTTAVSHYSVCVLCLWRRTAEFARNEISLLSRQAIGKSLYAYF